MPQPSALPPLLPFPHCPGPTIPSASLFPYPPGGPLDVTARAIAEEARADLGNIIVENKPGAGGNIGVEYVSKQKPDGKIFVMGALATHAVNP